MRRYYNLQDAIGTAVWMCECAAGCYDSLSSRMDAPSAGDALKALASEKRDHASRLRYTQSQMAQDLGGEDGSISALADEPFSWANLHPRTWEVYYFSSNVLHVGIPISHLLALAYEAEKNASQFFKALASHFAYAPTRAGFREFAEAVADHGRRVSALAESVTQEYSELTPALIREDVDVNAVNNEGETALMILAYEQHEHVEIAKMLIERGALIDKQDKDGLTALMIAADMGHREIVCLLLDAGADTEIQDRNGATAFNYAKGSLRTEFSNRERNARFKVVLTDVGGSKLDVIKLLRRRITGLGLREAKWMVDNAPSVIGSDFRWRDAEYLHQDLIDAGAKATIEPPQKGE